MDKSRLLWRINHSLSLRNSGSPIKLMDEIGIPMRGEVVMLLSGSYLSRCLSYVSLTTQANVSIFEMPYLEWATLAHHVQSMIVKVIVVSI